MMSNMGSVVGGQSLFNRRDGEMWVPLRHSDWPLEGAWRLPLRLVRTGLALITSSVSKHHNRILWFLDM